MKETDIDPVEELHRIRRALYKKAGGTPEAYVRYLLEQQKQYADRLVDLSKPRRKAAKPAASNSTRKPGRRGKAVAT